ncbi:MAG: fibronectin type III domain-containing protein [Lachnospiraceae bacterium]|nr:fibronectin type III domain-containing protein [Lachnospiraceae bacterium]
MKKIIQALFTLLLFVIVLLNVKQYDLWAATDMEEDATFIMAVDELDQINETSDDVKSDDEMQKVYDHYAQLQQFYEQNPDYFGIASPYFTSKDTKEGPISALLSIADIPREAIGVEGGVSIDQVDELVQGFNQALPALIQYYGNQLLVARDKALDQIDPDMTTEEKLLVLNDWLGNNCNFDMSSIMDITNNTEGNLKSEDIDEKVDTTLDDPLSSMMNSTAFGALVKKNTLCLAYTSAYTYLVQCAFPEIYKNPDGSWKTKEEVNGVMKLKVDKEGNSILDKNGEKVFETEGTSTYMVDFVRIQWNSQIEMLGEKSAFQNPHFFNAVKVNNKWYYIDTCYNDIYVECLQRNRVETDGNMKHSYFLVSDSSLRKQFNGNFDYIDTLYKDLAINTDYENAWFTKAQGPISFDKDNWYYVEKSYVMNNSSNNYQTTEQLVKRSRKLSFLDGTKNTVLINYEDGTGEVSQGAEFVTEEYKVDCNENNTKFSSIMHTAALYKNQLYLNVNNQILKYDIENNKITKLKEYNRVSVVQDKKNPFTGMSFTVVPENTKNIVHTVENHPIAAICIKDDGQLYVSIATNYTYASDYKFEETNYNLGYYNYYLGGQHFTSGGDNDNQEFMWSANFVDILDMKHVIGDNHSYENVKIDPTCEKEGYTQKRCTDCGIIDKEEKIDVEKATGHHYVHTKDRYYTKDKNGNYLMGEVYVCTQCLKSKNKLDNGEKIKHSYNKPIFIWSNDKSSCQANIECIICSGKELDCLQTDALLDDSLITTTLECKVTKTVPDVVDCLKGGKITYIAEVIIDGNVYSDVQEEQIPKKDHDYDENGICKSCGFEEPSEEKPSTEDLNIKEPNVEKEDSKIVLNAKAVEYTGKVISIHAAKVTGSTGKITYTYYIDKKCENKTTKVNSGASEKGSAPIYPGNYYVKATVVSDSFYKAATSNVAKLTILPKSTKVLRVYNSEKNVVVKWNKVGKASGYYIYRSSDGKKYSKIKTITKNSIVNYNDKKAISNGKRYSYKIYVYYKGFSTVTSKASVIKTIYRLDTPKISSLKNSKSGKLTIKWKKKTKINGYQIQYSTNKSFKGGKTVTIASSKKTSMTVSKLKKENKYYVRVRSYKKISKTKYYSNWSTSKNKKVTK